MVGEGDLDPDLARVARLRQAGLTATLPAAGGTYAVALRCTRPEVVAVGRLGSVRLLPGYYVYVGSARGPGGLRARLGRHLAGAGRRRWHIDYLRARLAVAEAWYAAGGGEGVEHAWAAALASLSGAEQPARGFGASDCRCSSHLFFFHRLPSPRALERRLAARGRGGASIRTLEPRRRGRSGRYTG